MVPKRQQSIHLHIDTPFFHKILVPKWEDHGYVRVKDRELVQAIVVHLWICSAPTIIGKPTPYAELAETHCLAKHGASLQQIHPPYCLPQHQSILRV